MDLNKKLEELKPYQLNCNVFDVYSYNGLTMQDLLCQFFTKINECITVSNETIDLAKWLVNEGLEIEVVKKLMIWLEDGTLENIINVNLFNTLNEKINGLSSQLEHHTSMVNKIINNFDNIDLNINYNYNRILNGMDVNYNNGFKGIYEGEYILNNHRFKYSNKTPKTLNSTLSLEHGIKDSFIIKEGDIYYMFFTSFEESDGDIGYATSLDLKNWVYKGIVIRKDQACWSEKLPIWAPYISPKQSDGYYYMFVSGASPYKSCIFKSKSLTSGWSYYDYVKNNVGGVINGIDVNITKIDDKYIMLIANNNETPSIEMYLSDDLTLNNWVYVKDVVTKTEDWEGSVIEAGQLLKINNNQYAIFYGGGGSQTSQHIGLAVSNTLFGDYKKVGLNGMLMLDLPIDYKCIIAHPNIFFENGIYYIYCTISNNANKNEIICYTTTNFKDITPLTYSEDINCIEKGVLYINPYNDLIVSNLVPNQINAHVNFNKNLRLGIIALGYFTSDNFIRFRVYDYLCSINAKNEKLNLENDSDAFQTSFINVKLPTNDMASNGTLVAKLMISYKCSSSSGFNIAVQSNGVKKPIFDINLTQLGVSSWVNKNTNWEKWTPSDVDDIGITTKRLSSDGFYSLGENTTLHFAIEY